MTDLLSPEQRQALAELAGLKRGGPEGWEPDYHNDNKKIICPITKWLSGDLTNEAAYYQIHLVIEAINQRGVIDRDAFVFHLGLIIAVSQHDTATERAFMMINAKPLAIAKAALEVLKDE